MTTIAAPSTARIWGAMVIVYIVWGSTYLGTALMVETIPGLTGSAVRFFIAATAMAVIIAIAQGPGALKVTRAQFASSALLGVLLLSVGVGTASIALGHVPSGIAALIVATTPLWVVIVRTIHHDRPRPLTLIGVAVGLLGLGLMLLPGGDATPSSGPAVDGTALVGASIALVISSAIWAYGSWAAPRLPITPHMLTHTTYQMAVAGVVLMVVGFLSGERWEVQQTSTASWLGLVFLVIFGSLVSYTAFTWLVLRAPISLVSTYAYVNPAVAVLLGVIAFGEVISGDVIVGVLFVLGGVVLVVSGERVRTSRRMPLTDPGGV